MDSRFCATSDRLPEKCGISRIVAARLGLGNLGSLAILPPLDFHTNPMR